MTPESEKVQHDLRRLLGAANVLTAKEDLIAYSFDGTAALQHRTHCDTLRERASSPSVRGTPSAIA